MTYQKNSRRGSFRGQTPAARGGKQQTSLAPCYPRARGKSSGRRVFTVTPQGTRAVGFLERRGDVLVLVKHVNSQKHRLRFPEESWGVDEDAVLRAQAAGATRVEIADERGRLWWTRLDYLLAEGQQFDRGWGRQVRLPLRLWSYLPAGCTQLPLLEA